MFFKKTEIKNKNIRQILYIYVERAIIQLHNFSDLFANRNPSAWHMFRLSASDLPCNLGI